MASFEFYDFLTMDIFNNSKINVYTARAYVYADITRQIKGRRHNAKGIRVHCMHKNVQFQRGSVRFNAYHLSHVDQRCRDGSSL